ncbi:O-antigen ligase family protein [Glaciimonas soli]|uniref:O-antigen ligase-related domain-containing protein n=1 Tax=Glaciimonas soli TaxID=2590999 RepID=A0A843YRP3_9BURK|nr:O-antigen ligase family protein [Glaciimonas soli]MQR00168.1 hypothetical protein [Glaciimonas soli]
MSSYFKWPVFIAIMCFPALSISLHNAGNACLFFLFILALIAAICRYKPMGVGFTTLLKDYWPLHLAMISAVIAVLLNQASTGRFSIKYYDTAFRIALFIPIFWVVLDVPLAWLKKIQWAFVAGTILALIKIFWFTQGGESRPANIGFMPTIPFSDMGLMFGVIALLTIGWNERHEKLKMALKILACCAGVYITILSLTRGSWIAIPVFMVIIFAVTNGFKIKHKLIVLIAIAVALSGVFVFNKNIQTRFVAAKSDMTLYAEQENANDSLQKNVDTSLGFRLQLWHASWELFKTNPVFGVGRDNFSSGLDALAERKIITPDAAAFPHSHNEILFNMAILGIFGLLATLSIYFVPAYYFFREMRHPDRQIRIAAASGLVICLGFFMFGLTDMMFFWNVTGGIYSMSIAAFLACIIKRKKELEWATR